MDAISIVAAAAIAGGIYAGSYGEFEYNVQPSVFPPIDGPISLPDRAQGFVQGRGTEFLRQLSPAEQHIWDGLEEPQRVRAASFIRNGGTLISSFGSDF